MKVMVIYIYIEHHWHRIFIYLLLEIFPKMSKSFLVGILYRHPNESIHWNENFEMFIDKI